MEYRFRSGLKSCSIIIPEDPAATLLCETPTAEIVKTLQEKVHMLCQKRGIGGESVEIDDSALAAELLSPTRATGTQKPSSAWFRNNATDGIVAFALTTSVLTRSAPNTTRILEVIVICSAVRGEGAVLLGHILDWCKDNEFDVVALSPSTPFSSQTYMGVAERKNIFMKKRDYNNGTLPRLEFFLGGKTLVREMCKPSDCTQESLEQLLNSDLHLKEEAVQVVCEGGAYTAPLPPICHTLRGIGDHKGRGIQIAPRTRLSHVQAVNTSDLVADLRLALGLVVKKVDDNA